MRLAVVGCRDWSDTDLFNSILGPMEGHYHGSGEDLILVSGGADGADKMAEGFARSLMLEIVVYPANWAADGKAAGPKRNTQIVNDADALIAFWDGKSTGTKDSITKARAKGINVLIVYKTGEVEGRYPTSARAKGPSQ